MSCISYISVTMKRRLLAGDPPLWIVEHCRRQYIHNAYLAAPPWVRRSDFQALRDEAKRLTEATGVKHVLDHIVPLTHPYVCGLTVPWNIRVVPRAVNAAKGNSWNPHQLELL